jgi:predicted metal-dependent hydrolase
VPYYSANEFVKKKRNWISSKTPAIQPIEHGDTIGREHVVCIEYVSASNPPAARVLNDMIKLKIPLGMHHKGSAMQKQLVSACERALRKEALAYLPQRLADLARLHNFTYKKVTIKKMQSRWGSCSHEKKISLNMYLMQLNDELIDYVLLHELAHTKVLSHSKEFWGELASHVKNVSELRKAIKQEEPVIRSSLYTQKD